MRAEQWLTPPPPHTPTHTHLPLTDLLEAIPELREDVTNHPGRTLNYMALALHTVSQWKGGGREGGREGRSNWRRKRKRKLVSVNIFCTCV